MLSLSEKNGYADIEEEYDEAQSFDSPTNQETNNQETTDQETVNPPEYQDFKFGGETYKLPTKTDSFSVIMQVMANKDYLEEMFHKKAQRGKNPKLLGITNYRTITAVEFLLRHHDPKHSSIADEKCSICLDNFFEDPDKLNIIDFVDDLNSTKGDEIILLERCDGHYFHLECMLNYISAQSGSYIKCPVCTRIYGVLMGDQPQGYMQSGVNNTVHCQGYQNCGTIVIQYNFPSGVLPNGTHYHGTSRVGYLPDNEEGNEVLSLLKTAFERKLIFTVGTSVTTGRTNCVVWNGIHHKTSLTGGFSMFGYPDATYLNRVKQELASKGIVSEKNN